MSQDFTWAELGQNIRDRRRAMQLSQKQLAQSAGLTPPGLCCIELGMTNPQLDSLQKIATALATSVRALLGGPELSRSDEAMEIFGRVQRVIQSQDESAKQAFWGGLNAAEALLNRSGRKDPLPKVRLDHPQERANALIQAFNKTQARRTPR